MAKRPEDRFPSAGEFGRAALAAAGSSIDSPTAQIVATGGAASAGAATVTARAPLPATESAHAASTQLRSTSERAVTVVVVDDHPFFRDGVRRALERSGQIAVIGEADNSRDGLEAIRRELPNVALVDYQMPDMDGIALLEAVVRDRLDTRVLLLSAIVDSATVFRAVELGAAGYMSKDARREVIVDGVLSAARGDTVVPTELAAGLAAEIRQRAHSQAGVAIDQEP